MLHIIPKGFKIGKASSYEPQLLKVLDLSVSSFARIHYAKTFYLKLVLNMLSTSHLYVVGMTSRRSFVTRLIYD